MTQYIPLGVPRALSRATMLAAGAALLLLAVPGTSEAQYRRDYGGRAYYGGHWHGGGGGFWPGVALGVGIGALSVAPYYAPPVYYAPPPVYYAPPPAYYYSYPVPYGYYPPGG